MKLIKAEDRPRAIYTGNKISMYNYFYSELAIADRIMDDQSGQIFSVNNSNDGNLTFMQTVGMNNAFTSPITIIDAPPGYGKTHTIGAICQVAILNKIPVSVGTFMARAANRVDDELRKLNVNVDDMIEGGPATLHRLFRLNNKGISQIKNKTFDRDNPGIFIVDESSMIDTNLMAAIINNIPDTWNIILFGDRRQLQPVRSEE